MTSNAGARLINKENRLGFTTDGEGILGYEDIKSSAMGELKRIFSPEFINRVDDIVVFNALTKTEVASILEIQIGELRSRLDEQGISLGLRPAARVYLVDNGYEPAFGARPMRRLIQREIEDPLSLLIIEGKVTRGDAVRVDAKDGKLTVRTIKKKNPTLPPSLTLTDPIAICSGIGASGDGDAL
jgi:ATP-dependent Clp protease ATP-binding subunit ClpC